MLNFRPRTSRFRQNGFAIAMPPRPDLDPISENAVERERAF